TRRSSDLPFLSSPIDESLQVCATSRKNIGTHHQRVKQMHGRPELPATASAGRGWHGPAPNADMATAGSVGDDAVQCGQALSVLVQPPACGIEARTRLAQLMRNLARRGATDDVARSHDVGSLEPGGRRLENGREGVQFV